MNNSKNVPFYLFEKNSINELKKILDYKRNAESKYVVFFIDQFFKDSKVFQNLPISNNDLFFFVETIEEPSTNSVNNYYKKILELKKDLPCAVIGIGGGCTMDTAKAISNLLTNNGKAEDYQGWDLLKVPGIYKIGIPTISGTGAEASRTCVMTNKVKNLKLGMNSQYTIFDQLILDHDLTKTVPRNQYFYTGMDTYIHCIESLNGSYRHAIADAFSGQALKICREVFESEDMQNDLNREKLMTASYLGGSAIANSYVGVVHPFSAGLSIVLGIHHCIGNCIVMNVMEEFYPKEIEEFHSFVNKQNIEIPNGITKNLTDDELNKLYLSTIIHEKPLNNALGENFKKILSKEKVIDIFRKM